MRKTDSSYNPRMGFPIAGRELDIRLVVDAIPALAWSACPDGSVNFVNERWHVYTGLSLEESHGWGWQVAFHPEDLPPLMKRWQELLVSCEPGEIEARLRRHDGVYRWFLISVEPFRDETGKIVRWYGTNTDIEERKRVEEALRASERNTRLIVDSIPGLIVRMTATGEVEVANRRHLEYFGKSLEDIKDCTTSAVVHPEDLPRALEIAHHSFATGDPYEMEIRARRFDGVYRWFQVRGLPVRDAEGRVLHWYALHTDIDDRKNVEERLRAIIDTIPTLAWSAAPDGSADFLNQRWLNYTGLTSEQSLGWGWGAAIHPNDVKGLVEYWQSCLASGMPAETEARMLRFDGTYRWFLFRANALRDESGTIVKWYGTNTDIDDRKRAEEALRASEFNARMIVDGIPGLVARCSPAGEVEVVNQPLLEYFGKDLEEIRNWQFTDAIYPDDLPLAIETFNTSIPTGHPFDVEHRLRRFDGVYRWFQSRGLPLRDPEGRTLHWYVLLTDIEERKQAEDKLRRSEGFLAEGQRLSRTGSFSWRVETDEITWSEQLCRIFEFDDHLPVTLERIGSRVYPDDPLLQNMLESARSAVSYFEYQHRLLMPDQSVKHIHLFAHATRDKYGRLEYVGAAQDVTDLYTITDAIANPVVVLTSEGATLYVNRVALNQWGLTPSDAKNEGFFPRACHPDDIERMYEERRVGLVQGVPFELELRLLKDGKYRWQLIQYNPLKDESGNIVRWYATATDIDDQKRTEERLRNENLVLREQIDRDSMFEDIVGSSEVLHKVLRHVAKVAPSDSTVLILGETGTGKELIARAIHKRSHRAERAFIGVNCAAIPQSLIASELFGHEKGAFTGATQRRLGRFESANGGTLFLDEVGDLPAEIQIALLRVLQEREVERVGASKPIPVDVRVLAATHRDLNALVDEGKFRQDLLYRLNVVPIEIPSLRERKGDIPLLVEYYIDRFGKKAGKKFRAIEKKSLKLLQLYDWPGNIRELQNVIERAVILCEDDETFSVDETWLRLEMPVTLSRTTALNGVLLKQEKEMIEAALAESQGQISGPTGAATKLGLPARTLDSKIKRLRINKYRFKGPHTI
jgi:PAS domain S-box-containing protein